MLVNDRHRSEAERLFGALGFRIVAGHHFLGGYLGDQAGCVISLTLVCCKILEHIMYHYITEHLNTNNILIDEQFDFRAGHSCESQLISVVEDIQLAMDNTSQVDMIFIDFRKAFDTVTHCRLL